MSLNPRAIALHGIGFAPLALATLGLRGVEEPPEVQPSGGAFSNRPWLDVPFIPITPRRPRKKRQEELVFLGH
jgi:hypothetical protein